MTDQEKLILEGTDPTYLTKDQIGGLSRYQISGLSAWAYLYHSVYQRCLSRVLGHLRSLQ